MDQMRRKLMTMYMALQLINDIERMSRKEGRGIFTNIEDCVAVSVQGVKNYIKKQKKNLS